MKRVWAMLRRVRSVFSLAWFLAWVRAASLLALLLPFLRSPIRACIEQHSFKRLSTDRTFARVTSFDELPTDAVYWVVHDVGDKIMLYPCENEREAAVYQAVARKRNDPVHVYNGVPRHHVDLSRKVLYFPGLVFPNQPVTMQRRAWIEAMQQHERARLAHEFHVD